MADDTPTPLRRAMTSDGTLRRRRISSQTDPSRRSSNISDYSLRSFQTSTDDLLLPKAGRGEEEESSVWQSAPLGFALLPAAAGMVFTNGGAVVTDVTLLVLGGVFLNWSVRVPW